MFNYTGLGNLFQVRGILGVCDTNLGTSLLRKVTPRARGNMWARLSWAGHGSLNTVGHINRAVQTEITKSMI